MNTHIRQTSRRTNFLLALVLGLMRPFYSYSRLILEVLFRRNMGRRYFSLMSVFTLSVILFIMPPIFQSIHVLYINFRDGFVYRPDVLAYRARFATWHYFIGLFWLASYFRWNETRKNRRLSLQQSSTSSGESFVLEFMADWLKWQVSPRKLETLIEPALAFIAGYILSRMGQSIGTLLMFSAVCYSFSYIAAYRIADDILSNKVDAIIGGQLVQETLFQDQQSAQNGHGTFHADKPKINMPLPPRKPAFVDDKDEPMVAD